MHTFEHNPLGYYCAPNGATPDYVAACDFEQFMAYGLVLCDLVGEDNGSGTEADTYWLRKDFIDYMKDVVKYYREVDCGTTNTNWDPSNGVNLGCMDDGTDETFYNWIFDQRDDDGTLAVTFHWSFMPVSGQGSSDQKTIWLDPEALEDTAKVEEVFAKAESANELGKPTEIE